MSKQYPGGVISKTAPTPSGAYQNSTAPGVWTLEDQAYWQKLGQWPTQGNVDPSAFIENLFSPYLYTGTGAAQTITNGIDLSTKGGLVWIKSRSSGANYYDHVFCDTVRGPTKYLASSGLLATAGEQTGSGPPNDITSFNNNGFSLGPDNTFYKNTGTSTTYASWTFRKQAKFFDIVTYTGNGVAGRAISHNLGSTPGFIAVKKTSNTGDWLCYHQARPAKYFYLNSTAAEGDDSTGVVWGNGTTAVAPTSTNFTVNALTAFPSADINKSGETYVAYIFAHDAGGFGLTGTDNVISCGSFTTSGSGQATVDLGYEPQWIMMKATTGSESWQMYDTMRGWSVRTSGAQELDANSTSAEAANNAGWPTATGFFAQGQSASRTYIYIAIRRGPMAVPTVGTNVFNAIARTGTGANATVTAGFNPDFAISAKRTSGEYMPLVDKLRGPTAWLTWQQGKTDPESTGYAGEWFTAFTNTGVTVGADNSGGQAVNASGSSLIQYYFQRAPGFMDTVCYTGDSTTPRTITHNLGVAPELMFIKSRSNTRGWATYVSGIGAGKYLLMNTTNAALTDTTIWANTAPTSSVFTVGNPFDVNNTGYTYVAHLFATCPGVSKVGSYTGNATLTTINCGFTGGARYVLIKRTDSTSDWLMWDTARGMVSGTDPSISSNYQGAEINADSVYTIATGFQLLASPSADVNTNGGTYIYLAIA